MISIIIPTYNRKELLLRSVRSVLSQTYADLECIVVDDGSTDGTEEAVRTLSDPRLRYVRQEKAGACAARNAGVDLAQGEFIAFQDSDDLWHLDKLEHQLALLEQTGADVVACTMLREGRVVPEHARDGQITMDVLLSENLCSTQCILGRAEVFREVRFDVEMPRLQDWDLILRVAQQYTVWMDCRPLVDVFPQPDSLSNQPRLYYEALLRLYERFHKDITADRGANRRSQRQLAYHWMRQIVEATPDGENPWTPDFLNIAPQWVFRMEQLASEGQLIVHCQDTAPSPNPHGIDLFMGIEYFMPSQGGYFLPDPMLPELMRTAADRIEFVDARYVFRPDSNGALCTGLRTLSRWKGCRYAWDILTGAFGVGPVVQQLTQELLGGKPQWGYQPPYPPFGQSGYTPGAAGFNPGQTGPFRTPGATSFDPDQTEPFRPFSATGWQSGPSYGPWTQPGNWDDIPDAAAWAKALRDIRLPEKTGPVRHIGVFYHRIYGGGAQRTAAALIRLWVEMGYRVTLITEMLPTPEDEPLPPDVQRITIPPLDAANAVSACNHVNALQSAVQGLDLLVYHAWAAQMIFFDLLAVRGTGCRFLVHTHSVFTLPLLEPDLRDRFPTLPDIYALAHGVVTLSDADACYWRSVNPRVYTTVNPLTFDPAQTPVNPLIGKRILWVGRESPEKRMGDALRIFYLVQQRIPDVQLTLLGVTEDITMPFPVMQQQPMQQPVAQDSQVKCVRYVRDPRPYYAQADLLLCTSAYEGFSLAMAEAQTFGIPCVTYDMPYLTVLQGGGHVSVPQEDAVAAADAIVELLTDGPRRVALGRAARENVEQNLNIDQRAKWQGIFDDLAAPRLNTPTEQTPESIMVTTLRNHVLKALDGHPRSNTPWPNAGPQFGGYAPPMPDMSHTSYMPPRKQPNFVPMPTRGPLKKVRKKAATFLQALLIDGFSGVRRVIRERSR